MELKIEQMMKWKEHWICNQKTWVLVSYCDEQTLRWTHDPSHGIHIFV